MCADPFLWQSFSVTFQTTLRWSFLLHCESFPHAVSFRTERTQILQEYLPENGPNLRWRPVWQEDWSLPDGHADQVRWVGSDTLSKVNPNCFGFSYIISVVYILQSVVDCRRSFQVVALPWAASSHCCSSRGVRGQSSWVLASASEWPTRTANARWTESRENVWMLWIPLCVNQCLNCIESRLLNGIVHCTRIVLRNSFVLYRRNKIRRCCDSSFVLYFLF